jgi:hypothetical protein
VPALTLPAYSLRMRAAVPVLTLPAYGLPRCGLPVPAALLLTRTAAPVS